jgi:anti-anti-sigma regulatory factor
MPACSLEREVNGSTALFRISGNFDGACAWQLAGRLEQEPLSKVVIDFSQANEFVDSGIAVIARALVSSREKEIRLEGLRHHQERLFKYFGVDPSHAIHRRLPMPRLPEGPGKGAAKEVI